MMQFILCPSFPTASFLTHDLVTLQFPNWILPKLSPWPFLFLYVFSLMMDGLFYNLHNVIFYSDLYLWVCPLQVCYQNLLLGISHIFIKSETKSYELFFQSLFPVTPFFPSSLPPTSFKHLILYIQVIANSF